MKNRYTFRSCTNTYMYVSSFFLTHFLYSIFLFQKAKKELDKKKADEKYEKWLTELKLNEMARKQKIAEQKRLREQREAQEKARRAELALKMAENKKQLIKVRKLEERKGVAIVNGKLRAYYDWSTSPDPTFLNKDTWKS